MLPTKRVVVALAASLAMAGVMASVPTVSLDPIAPGTIAPIYGGLADSTTVPYLTDYTFTVPNGSVWSITGGVNGGGSVLPPLVFQTASIVQVSLIGAPPSSLTSFVPGVHSTFGFDNLGAGSYALRISAILAGLSSAPFGIYSGAIVAEQSLGSTSVPEPTGLLLTMSGLGVCGWLLRRRS
jgi:hypothetical protein